jgi:TolB-like protein
VNLRRFFAELKRRNVYKVAVAYAIVGWLVIQISSTVLPTFHTPEWVVQTLVVVVVLGFPIALIFAWAFELTPEGIKRAEDVVPSQSITHGTGQKLTVLIVFVAVVAAVLLLLQLTRHKPAVATGNSVPPPAVSQFAAPGIPEKSIAVLPFQNLSRDPDNAFFASGIQDEIITALAKVSGLKVISRTSTAHYQSSPENLPQIAGELRVANILEGSVQKAGDKVHINVQLVRADTDAHLWAQSYDRGLADIFAVEAEVARSIAESLQTALSPEEKAHVETKPTENADAYVLYLRARDYQTRPTDLLQDFETAEHLYTRALQLDPGFALAHARLSATLAQIYLNYQPTADLKKRARGEAEESLRLRPDLGEGHLSRARCLYWTEKDYDAALRELEIAARLLPNNVDVESTIAYIRRRQGRWSEALAGIKSVLGRDPQNATVAEQLFLTECAMRDWSAAAAAGRRALAIAPDSPTLGIEVSYVDLWSKGDLRLLRTALNAIPAGVDPDGGVTAARWDAALLARDFAAAERVIAACARETVLNGAGSPLPKTYLLGCVALARGDAARAQQLFEAARPGMEGEALATPLDASRHAQLGLLYAYLGRKEDALREGHRAVELLPESKDAYNGPLIADYFALICARTGESERALSLIEHLLTTPGGVTDYIEANMTLQELRLRWQWDPLRNDPRFQKILAGPEPKTVYK